MPAVSAVSNPTATTFDLTLADAVARSGYSERQLRRLRDAGQLRAAKQRGRLYFIGDEIDALAQPQALDADAAHERLVAEIVANAPGLSPARRARIRAAIAGEGA
ncbi:helix-turn-helix domain-containing protein [Gordonia sp. SND2]|uniref:helix-turn-helix domain-containing protein n=1 Tax=Gordonia sp. SND2 TaxID=3388659 RepID=UPI00398B96E6